MTTFLSVKGSSKPIFVVCLVAGMLSLFTLIGGASSASSHGIEAAALKLSLVEFASGLSRPLGLTHGGGRLFVYEKAGRIKIIRANGQVISTPFLNITDRVQSSGSEQGLLGLAFHPDYATNGYFYVNYTHTAGSTTRTRISRFQVSSNPNLANAGSETVLLTVVQPYPNHNAGDLHFGPDGYLYIPLGDGGSGGDPQNYAQNMRSLLGKVVRIDVDAQSGTPADCRGEGSGSYTIPATNPFRDGSGGTCDEIWASGLRNPWRSSFDRLTGDLYIGDVGQGNWEEINFQPSGASGKNYGWRCYEGNHFYNADGCQERSRYTFPVFEYAQAGTHCSVIAGYVYRGAEYPAMYGHFLLTDYCSGRFWDLECTSNGWQVTQYTHLQAQARYVAFGEDAKGELYVVGMGNNTIYRLVENTAVTPTSTPPTPSEDDKLLYFPLIRKQLTC